MNPWGMVKNAAARCLPAVAFLLVAMSLAPAMASAATHTYVVANTNDQGAGSLRQAILESNVHPAGGSATNLITFSIGTGAQTISPGSALPAITAPVVIDGASQPGFESAPLIRLDGASAGAGAAGLTVSAPSSAIQNLEITGFQGSGVVLGAGGSDTVSGSYIGTDGASALANAVGITVSGAHNSIGGLSASGRNVISGNTTFGVLITGSGASNNLMIGNYVGTGATGTTAVGNGLSGIEMLNRASSNSVGNTRSGARNVVSGNGNDGVLMFGAGTRNNVVQGNYVGITAAGTAALPNGNEGVGVSSGSTNNTIGGTTVAARNVVSGNMHDGVGINTRGSSGNVVEGNYIGTNPAGTAAVPNQGMGAAIFNGATDNTIGGSSPHARNVISGNAGNGVALANAGTTGNHVKGNFIGLKPSGRAALGNQEGGLAIFAGASRNTVGGTAAPARNVISGNPANGVAINDPGSDGNVLQGNFIGTNATGGGAIPNSGSGVFILNGASHNTIGGTVKGAGNRIAHNGSRGVHVDGSKTVGDRVEGNSIFANKTRVGIALTKAGNANQAAPRITGVTVSAGSTKITLHVPAGRYRVELFANPSCADPEGKGFLGFFTKTGGTWTVTLNRKLPAGQGITATATNTATSNTSRFSHCRAVP